MQIYLYQNDTQVGPYTEDQLREMVKSGNVSQTENAWHEGISEWRPLNQIISIVGKPNFPPPPKESSVHVQSPREKGEAGLRRSRSLILWIFLIGIVAILAMVFRWISHTGGLPQPSILENVLTDTPTADFAAQIIKSNIQENAHNCIKLIDCQKTNGLEQDIMGRKVYELDCQATIVFLHDCYWDWEPTFSTDRSPLAEGFTVKPNHEIEEKPRPPLPANTGGVVNVYGAIPWPAMRHYWHEGDKATITNLKFGFEKTEQGWRDERGNIITGKQSEEQIKFSDQKSRDEEEKWQKKAEQESLKIESQKVTKTIDTFINGETTLIVTDTQATNIISGETKKCWYGNVTRMFAQPYGDAYELMIVAVTNNNGSTDSLIMVMKDKDQCCKAAKAVDSAVRQWNKKYSGIRSGEYQGLDASLQEADTPPASKASPSPNAQSINQAPDTNIATPSDVKPFENKLNPNILSGERYPDTRTRLLTAKDIQGWGDAKILYAINEVYARHGADFNDKGITQWFSQFDWYHLRVGVSITDVKSELSDIEKQNVDLLQGRIGSTVEIVTKQKPGVVNKETWINRDTVSYPTQTHVSTNTLSIRGTKFEYTVHDNIALNTSSPNWNKPDFRKQAYTTCYYGTVFERTNDIIKVRINDIKVTDISPSNLPIPMASYKSLIGCEWTFIIQNGNLADATKTSTVFRRQEGN